MLYIHTKKLAFSSHPLLSPQLMSNAVVFVCGIAVGAFHKVLMEKALRQTFQDTLRCLSVRMKLEIEKRQQVWCTRYLQAELFPLHSQTTSVLKCANKITLHRLTAPKKSNPSGDLDGSFWFVVLTG